MEKDFDRWNNLKKKIDYSSNKKIFNEKQVWWCKLGINIGSEQNGSNKDFERPVLIIKKFNKDILIILPLTSNHKNNAFKYKLSSESSVILSQVRLISSKRLLREIYTVQDSKFNIIKNKLINIIK